MIMHNCRVAISNNGLLVYEMNSACFPNNSFISSIHLDLLQMKSQIQMGLFSKDCSGIK